MVSGVAGTQTAGLAAGGGNAPPPVFHRPST